jgi:peptidoglycan/xylan/chitin deacetylase (PgdA/CDA1 family)
MPSDAPVICLTFDFDAICVWPAIGMSSATPLSRGEFGARVAMPRILKILEREGIPATFFTPGHTVDTFPDLCREVRDAGHEFGHHGYFHEGPATLDEAGERDVLQRGLDAMDRNLGLVPSGYRSPSFDLSDHSTRLLQEFGFAYDSSMMAQDFEPYRCRVGDVLHADRAFEFGEEIDLVELPCSWSLDDFPQFEFAFSGVGVLPGSAYPDLVRDRWLADLDFMVEEVPGGVFTMTFHPQTIGRGARIRILEAMIARGKEHGARFLTAGDAVSEWAAANPREAVAS